MDKLPKLQISNFSNQMSSVAHRYGEFRISNIFYCFLQAGAVRKIKTNIQNLTPPNRCATMDIKKFVDWVDITGSPIWFLLYNVSGSDG